MYLSSDHDIIAAIATPAGRGGVAILRISGHDISGFLKQFLSKYPQPRKATFANFLDANGEAIDQGIAIFFPSPHSFTGESVLELHGHGGPAVMDVLLRRSLELGARLARAGEFSERAFLNDKIDLTQAEAIADLINASSEQAAKCALRSLQGEFSKHISILVESLTTLRIYVEAAIDFPEEEIDFLADPKISNDLNNLITELSQIKIKAKQGALISEGMTVVIAGKPNAGKSSLLNALSGRESAIVTSIAGTTRDVLKEHIHIDGMPLHIIDTAGLRETKNLVEKEGIKRAWDEIDRADRVLFIIDSADSYSLNMQENWPDFFDRYPDATNISFVLNKADVSQLTLGVSEDGYPVITLSAKYCLGIEGLTTHLTSCMGFAGTNEGSFVARRRHIEALISAEDYLLSGQLQLLSAGAGELLAEDLRLAQKSLALITGAFTSDDLLGRIFSSFCVGK